MARQGLTVKVSIKGYTNVVGLTSTSALMLFVGQQEEHPVRKILE